MRNADKYRANAVHCFRMANKALDPMMRQARTSELPRIISAVGANF